jgi:hypothetical protein
MDPSHVVDPLVEEATKKAAIAWLDGQPVWCLWREGALYVVHGPGEQPAPALSPSPSTVDVALRGDHGGRIVVWPASVTRVEPGSAEWDDVVPALAAKRLNGSGTPEETAARWAVSATVSRLAPAG